MNISRLSFSTLALKWFPSTFSSIGVLALAFSVGLSSFASAQATMPGQTVQAPPSTATPQRMPARPLRPGETPPKGTAVIKGQVLASTGSPVRRAQVRAMSMEARGGGVTSTDAEGRFEIRDLPSSEFTMAANKQSATDKNDTRGTYHYKVRATHTSGVTGEHDPKIENGSGMN